MVDRYDPTGAEEHTAPDGSKFWIRPDVKEAGEAMARRSSAGNGTSNETDRNADLDVCKATGIYEINGANQKYFQGDKMPKGAKQLAKGADAVHPGGRGAEKLQARAARMSAEKQAAGKGKGKGGRAAGSSEPEPPAAT